jgi:predicted transcriptional regulator
LVDEVRGKSVALLEAVSSFVSSYVAFNAVRAADIDSLIQSIHSALAPQPEVQTGGEALMPHVTINTSVTPEYLICLEDGKRFKSLKHHLMKNHIMTPEDYRAKWNLPRSYPMVAPLFSKRRSELAKKNDIGGRVKSEKRTRGRPRNDG